MFGLGTHDVIIDRDGPSSVFRRTIQHSARNGTLRSPFADLSPTRPPLERQTPAGKALPEEVANAVSATAAESLLMGAPLSPPFPPLPPSRHCFWSGDRTQQSTKQLLRMSQQLVPHPVPYPLAGCEIAMVCGRLPSKWCMATSLCVPRLSSFSGRCFAAIWN